MMLWKRTAVFCLALMALSACGEPTEEMAEEISEALEQMPDLYPEEIPLLKLPTEVEPTHYTLDLTLDPSAEGFSGQVQIDLDVLAPAFIFYMHGEGLRVTRANLITEKDKKIGAQYIQVNRQGVVRISLDRPIKPGKYRLDLEFEAQYSAGSDGIYSVDFEGASYVFSQMQSISARRAFPSFDEPRFKTPFDVTLRVPSGLEAVTNGAVKSVERDVEGEDIYHFSTTQPLATEILAFAVGPFDVVEAAPLPLSALRDRPVPLRGLAPKGYGEQLEFLLETTPPLFAYFEEYFQQPYPFAKLDLVAIPDFEAGAMENAGAIFYRDSVSLVEANSPVGQLREVISTHAHEISHMWFGNLVTPEWWDDIWLNESFATWAAYKGGHELRPEWKFDRRAMENAASFVMGADSLAASRRLREPIETHGDIASIWDGISYGKGAAVLTMFEAYMGEEAFRDGIRYHMRAHAHGTADAYDFLTSLGEGSGKPEVAEAMRTFLHQPGVPMLDIEVDCDESGARARVSQTRSLPLGSAGARDQYWSLPFCYRTEAGESCHLLKGREEEVSIGDSCPEFIMPNSKGSGYYLWALDDVSFAKLQGEMQELAPLEKLSALKSVEAAYRGGLLNGRLAIDLVSPLANDADAAVVRQVAGLLSMMDRLWGEADEKPDFPALYQRLFGERFAALGLEAQSPLDAADPQGSMRLRRSLLPLFAEEVRDKDLRLTLKAYGEAFVGYGRAEGAQPAAVPRHLAGTSLLVALEENGAAFGDQMLEMLKEESDPFARSSLIYALTQTPDEAYGATLIERMMEGSTLRNNETRYLVSDFLSNEVLRAEMTAWLGEGDHIQSLTERLPVDDSWQVLTFGRPFCTRKERQAYLKITKEKSEGILGAERAISQTLESIDQCMAIRAYLQGRLSSRK